MEAGHQVGFLNRTLARGASDQLVCVIADINEAILVAIDGELRRIASGHGIGARKFLKLGLIKISCFEPNAANRVHQAMSLIEHEWLWGTKNAGRRRIFVEISDNVIRTFR